MEGVGVVVEVKGDGMALVQFRRHSICGKCGQCGGPKEKVGEAVNTAGAKAGDWVVVTMEPRIIIGAAFSMYILPILGLLLGYFMGERLAGSEGAGIIGGVTVMVLVFLGIRLRSAKIARAKEYFPTIKRLAQAAEVPEN